MFYQVYFTIHWVELGWRSTFALGQSSFMGNRRGYPFRQLQCDGNATIDPTGEGKQTMAYTALLRQAFDNIMSLFVDSNRAAVLQ